MDVKYFAFTLFCCSVAVGIVEFVTPESCKKQISCITGMIILLCMLTPLKSFKDFEYSFDIHQMDNNTAVTHDDIIEQQFTMRLSEIIQDKLQTIGIFADDIRIEINISETDISLAGITVMLSEDYKDKAETARMILSDYLETEVNVICGGGENDQRKHSKGEV